MKGGAETAGTLQLGNEKTQGTLICLYKFLMAGNEEEKTRLVSVDPAGKTRSTNFKIAHSV